MTPPQIDVKLSQRGGPWSTVTVNGKLLPATLIHIDAGADGFVELTIKLLVDEYCQIYTVE